MISGKRYINESNNFYLNILNVGKFYYNFFNKNLKKYFYLKDQDGFNMSCCKLDNNYELYCVRYLGTVPAYFGEEVIPGNFSQFSYNYIKKKIGERNIKIGKNFFWNNWNNLLDNSIFFVASYKNNTFQINKNIKPYIISNKFAYTNINENTLKYNDIRLFKIKNNIYCYDGLITSIYQIKIINNQIYIPINMDDEIYKTEFFYFKNKICSKSEDSNHFEKLYDKNWSFITSDEDNFEFLNWFENGFVTITLVEKKNNFCQKLNIIKMNKDIIDGLGSDNFPLFSFGTPFISIEHNDNNIIFNGIAAGHSKIILSKKYNNENINLFLEEIKNKFSQDNSYIQHNSYIYLSYFIKLTKYKNNKYKMFISDSYLFIDKNQKYKFSICFPMGLFEKNNNIVMSYGYGDYYNYLIEFNKNTLYSNIIHNVEEFNINDYKFILFNK